MDNSDSEYETEETVVLVELNGIIDTDLLLQQQTLTKILGIDTDEPLLQIGNCLFKGEYEDTLGTVVFYDSCPKDGSESTESDFKFLCKTDTKLTMKRCFPQERSMDNMKSTEVSSPVVIQNNKPKHSTTSKMKTPQKKKIIPKKKKLIKDLPKKKLKSKKSTKKDQLNSAKEENNEASKYETSEQHEEMAELTEDNLPRVMDGVSSEDLNLGKVDISISANSGSTDLQNGKKETDIPRKKRKRNHDEANDDTMDPDKNLEASGVKKTLIEVERNEAQVADIETVTFDKENVDFTRDNTILSDTEALVLETDKGDQQIIKEVFIETEVSTEISNECEMEEKSSTAFASETNEQKVMTEESITRNFEDTVINDATGYDINKTDLPLIQEESVPPKLVDAMPSKESEIQEESLLTHVSEMAKEPVIDEDNIVETVDNTTVVNESEIQEQCVTVNRSEMDKSDMGTEEDITETMESMVVNIESEIQQKSASASPLGLVENKEFEEEESSVKTIDSSIGSYKNVIYEESTYLNVPGDDTTGSLGGKIDETSLLLKPVHVMDNDNCSSFSNMGNIINEGISEQAEVCESSDDVASLHPEAEVLEKTANDASSSCQENEESMLLEKNVGADSNACETESNVAPDNLAALNSVEKDTICIVSQSANVEDGVNRKLSEFEGKYASIDSADESTLNAVDNMNPLNASDMITIPIVGETSSNARKHSSCEVTQSSNSAGEYLENKDLVSEYEVFSEPLEENSSEQIVTIEINDQFQTAEVQYPGALFDSDNIASEISQSCPESRISEEQSQVKFEADGAICSQSIEQPLILPEVPTEGKDSCVSSCENDDRSAFKECLGIEVYVNSGEDAEQVYYEEAETNVVCEVSQSDESENNMNVFSKSSENEATMLSNECDEESFANIEENQDNTIANQDICEITGSIVEAATIPSTSSFHEVTQSCSIEDVKLSDLSSEKNVSNECDESDRIEASHAPIEIVQDKLNDDYVSSADLPVVSETVLEMEADSDDYPNSEVSQSFRPAENQQLDEACKASNSEVVEVLGIEDTAVEFKHPSEVSHSSEVESVASLCNQESNIIECDRTEPSFDSIHSVEYQGEICESSDDASNIGSNSQVEEVQSAKYSMWEVSQSFRSEETDLTVTHSADSELESSNECEGFVTYEVPETNQVNTNEKNICESSDDVNEIESGIVIDQLGEREINICESSDDINEIETELIIHHSSVREKNVCESSGDINETESEIIIDQIYDSGENICESSDDVNETESEIIIDEIGNSGKNICESSADVHEIEAEIVIDQINDSERNICESSGDINETDSEIIIDNISNRRENICESSDDINESEPERIIDQLSDGGRNICESSADVIETEVEVITDQISDKGKNICESSDDVNETEPEIIINQLDEEGRNICESSDDVIETEAEIIIDQISNKGKNICESSDDVNEPEMIIDQFNDEGRNICESSDDVIETEAEIIIEQISVQGKNICESSGDINEIESEIIIDQVTGRGKNICESSDDVNETDHEIITDQLNDENRNICESSDDINETKAEITIDQLSDRGRNICESSGDVNQTEAEIIADQFSYKGKNICESSDDVNETECSVVIDQFSERERNICESSAEINETESEIIIDQFSDGERNICESSDDISENIGSIQQQAPIHGEGAIRDEACQSSKFDDSVLTANETEGLTSEVNLAKYETSVERSNIKNSTVCESSEDMISMGPNDQEPNSGACTSSDKSMMESSDVEASLLDSKSSGSVVSVDETENNQISQSSNVASGFIDISVNGAENGTISQSGSSVNISIYKSSEENYQISQSGGYLEVVSETESEISQSGGVAGGSNVVTLNETENNQISQSGCVMNSLSNVAMEETENDQISQSGNNENASVKITPNETENNQISQSGTVAGCSVDISITETENSLISQSGSVPIYPGDIFRTENENNLISQSGNAKEFVYDISVNESDNNQISQSSSSSNSVNNVISQEMGNNQISQSGNLTGNASETENNQISQSSNSGSTLIKESENYQISQSSSSRGPPNILSNETENNQISQSECNDNFYQQPSDSPFQAEVVVNVSSSSDIVSSNYVDVSNSSFHVSTSTIFSNSEVSPSLPSVRPHVWDRQSLVTSVTTSEMRTSVLSPEQTNEIESQYVQTSAHLAVSSCSVIIEENGENVASIDQEMSSSNINEVVESSLSLNRGEEEVNKHIPKDDSPMSVSESVIEEMPSTSQNLDRTNDERIQNTETNSSREDFQPTVSSNSLQQKQYEFDSNLLQTSFLPSVSSQSDTGNNSSIARPSFLEVMASSASDFRNSLLSENSFAKDKSHISSAPEPSGSNIGSRGEFSESFIREADGSVRDRNNDDESHDPANLSASTDNLDPTYSEVTRSSGIKRKYSDSGEFGYSQNQVSQSSDVVNTLSSTSRTHALISDNISQSSQQDFVQSSSNILRTSVLVSNDSLSLIDQVSSADENTSFVNKDVESADISESSIGVEAALPSCSQNPFSLANSSHLIESSSDQPTFTEDASEFKPENVESEVSSTPSETQYTTFKVLAEGNEQFPAIQGNVIILPGTSNVIQESDVHIATIEVTSPDSDYIPVRSDLNSEAVLILDSSNEAETLNRSSMSSPMTVQLGPFDRTVLTVDTSQARFTSSASDSPLSEVEAVNYEESSEVSESLVTNQNDISQSSLGDNNVSCSVSEFSTRHRTINPSCSFPDISQEAESKSSDDCISSYRSTCDNILPVPNLQSSADREFYSHVGEFDDSVQSSLDETHLAINEQIKAISSPPNSSDSASCEEQRSLSINPFVTFSSQSHVFSTNYGATSSKITLCPNSASEIGIDRDSLIEDSPQVITTTSNSDIIISSFDPELTNMSQSPQNSGSVCSPEQYVELSEQIVPAVQIAGADFIESSNDQLDDSQSVENSVSQNDVLNTDSES